MRGAIVRAFSGAGAGCESLDTDFGLEVTGADGGFRLGLASGFLLERVCELVFAGPPAGVALGVSDTVLLVMDFSDAVTQDSAQVELVLGAEEAPLTESGTRTAAAPSDRSTPPPAAR